MTAGRKKKTNKNPVRTRTTGIANRKTGGKPPAAATKNVPGNREKILATALRLITRYGVDTIPTSRISKEAGVLTGTLFYYFPNKNSLIDQLYLSIKKELAKGIRFHDDSSLPQQERIGQCMRGYIAWGVQNPLKVRFLDQYYNHPGIGEDVQNQAYDEFSWMAKLVASAVREGILPDLPCEFHAMIHQITSGIFALIEFGATGMSAEEITEHGLAMFWKR